jgi:hypothetical protein
VSFIRKTAGVPSIQCLVHCYGSATFFMAMLGGLQGVRSAAVSQIATHVKVPFSTEIKALFHAADFMDKLGIESMTAAHGLDVSHCGMTFLSSRVVRSGPLRMRANIFRFRRATRGQSTGRRSRRLRAR